MKVTQEKVYNDELDAFAAVIAIIESLPPEEWVQGITFGRWHPESGYKGLYWNISVARIVASVPAKPLEPFQIEQARQRGRDAAKLSLRDFQKREAEKERGEE